MERGRCPGRHTWEYKLVHGGWIGMGGPRLRHTFLRVLGPRSARHGRPVSVLFCGSSALPRNNARNESSPLPSTCRFLINSFLPVSEFYPCIVTRSGPFRLTEIQQLAANRPSCAVFAPRIFSVPRCEQTS